MTLYVETASASGSTNFDQRYLSLQREKVSDLERIGDYAENIVEYADSLKAQNATFSEPAIAEIKEMERKIHGTCTTRP